MSADETRRGGDLAPTVSRRILAARLRQVRIAADRTLDEVAEHLEVSTSKLSRLENEERAPVVADVRKLTQLYELSSNEADELIELAQEARRPSPYRAFAASGPERDYYGLEAAASTVRGVDLLQIHGLLQTSLYTRSLLEPLGRDNGWPLQLDQIVASRKLRQKRLLDPGDLELDIVIGEAALECEVGSPAVMLDQVGNLLEMSAWPNVTLRVLPFSAGATAGHVGSFVMLEFREPQLRDLVYVESLGGQVILDQPDEVNSYARGFASTATRALTPEISRAHLEMKQERWNAA